jgi:glycosyltransferase involved in cell wall biosynthesis
VSTGKGISVVIPTYNRELFLSNCLASVVAQTLQPLEVIVVDDGSTDNTRRLVHSMMEQAPCPIRYLYQENSGAAAARNLGINATQGALICFLDSDDRWYRDKLEVQAAAMSTHPSIRISHTKERWYRRGDHLNQKKKHQSPDGDIFFACLPMCVVGMSTVMMETSLFTQYGLFDVDLPCCEDYDLWLRISCQEPFLLVDQPLTIKEGGRADQLSVIHRVGMDRHRITALCKLLEGECLTQSQQRAALQELQRKCHIYGHGCIKYGRRAEGERFLQLSGQIAGKISQTKIDEPVKSQT